MKKRNSKIFKTKANKTYLVTLLIWITAVTVWEVNVTVCLGHYPPDRVPALPDDVAVVGVGDVHLHRDTCVGARVQHLRDHHLGSHHSFLSSSSNSDMWILLALCTNLQPIKEINISESCTECLTCL